MSTLVRAEGLDLQLLFPEAVAEVVEFLREVVRKREPLTLVLDDVTHVVNFANLAGFTLTERDQDDEALDADGVPTVVISLAEVRQ